MGIEGRHVRVLVWNWGFSWVRSRALYTVENVPVESLEYQKELIGSDWLEFKVTHLHLIGLEAGSLSVFEAPLIRVLLSRLLLGIDRRGRVT